MRGDIGVGYLLYLQRLHLHERNSSITPSMIARADMPNIK